jgi:hypothetical protein
MTEKRRCGVAGRDAPGAGNLFHGAIELGCGEPDGERPHSLVNVRCRRRNKIAR